MIVTQSGSLGGGSNVGAAGVGKAWAQWVNETQHGINGHPVEVVVNDDKGEGTTASSLARQFVERDGVAMVIAISDFAPTAIAPYLANQNVPFMSVDQGTCTATAAPTWYTVDLTAPYVFQGAALLAKNQGMSSFGAVACAEVAACKEIGTAIGEYAGKIGVDYRGLVTLSADATSATVHACSSRTPAHRPSASICRRPRRPRSPRPAGHRASKGSSSRSWPTTGG